MVKCNKCKQTIYKKDRGNISIAATNGFVHKNCELAAAKDIEKVVEKPVEKVIEKPFIERSFIDEEREDDSCETE